MTLLRRLALVCALLLAGAAPAHAVTLKSTCHAFSSQHESAEQVLADQGRWICGNRTWRQGQREVAWLRFDAAALARIGPARSLVSRISAFDRLSIAAIAGDGRVGPWRSYRVDELRPLARGPLFAVALPPLTGRERAVVVRVERPWNAFILSEARLSDDPRGEGWSGSAMLLVAAMCGLLFAPVLFNCVYYLVLRERFVLWHSAMAAGMVGYVIVSSGLVFALFPLSPWTFTIVGPISFMLPVAAAGMFAASYLEPDALSRPMRLACRLAAPWLAVLTTVFSAHWDPLRPIANAAFYLSFLPVLAVYAAAMAQATRRGSRAVRFQLAGWVPMMLVCLERFGRGIGWWEAPALVDQAIYLACLLEILITALGVADRFIVLRRERDRATARAEELEKAIERDPLTGLYNRHGIEDRFAAFRAVGFDTLAVIDLDHFKSVNDAMGHAVGDNVLAVAAATLVDDPDIIAWRLGGEEFLLLLRGSHATARAEARRQAIPSRVAASVPGLPAPVTASMGVVEMPRGAMLATTYAELYARADRLLYEAKHAGRNRTCSEKLTVFAGRERRKGADRRGVARQAA